MLRYVPGDSAAHRLDPRSKIALQVGFAAAAFAHTTVTGLAILSAVALAILGSARLSPRSALLEVRVAIPFLVAGPVVAGVTLGPPWFSPDEAAVPALASYRVVLVLLVSTMYVRTTPIRDSRAAIQWLVPGRPGRFLGMSVAVVFRFLPVLVADLESAVRATRARLGHERSVPGRISVVATAGLGRAFDRADRFGLALRARLFAWNPTLPTLRLRLVDGPALAAALVLVGWAIL